MKTWDDWSDFEINKAVAQANMMSFESMDEFRPEPYVWDEDAKAVFDPCNNWSDMGQIIADNKIEIGWHRADQWRAVIDNQFQAGDFRSFEYCHINPLRAAAIVFLEMNGVKP